jgi:hypothetical protein
MSSKEDKELKLLLEKIKKERALEQQQELLEFEKERAKYAKELEEPKQKKKIVLKKIIKEEEQEPKKAEQKITIIDGSRFIKKVNANTGEVSYREFKGKTSQALLDQLAKHKAGKGKNDPVVRKKYNITKKEKQIIRKVNIPEAIIEEIQIPEKKISIKSKTEKIKMSRQPTAYNLFFKENYDSTSGTPQERMKQIAEMYNRHKAGKSIIKKPIKKKVVENITKAKNPFGMMVKASKTAEKELEPLLPKRAIPKQRSADYIPPSILKGMSPELIKKLRKYYNPGKEYSLADELAEVGEI